MKEALFQINMFETNIEHISPFLRVEKVCEHFKCIKLFANNFYFINHCVDQNRE